MPRLYDDLAEWWPLLSDPADYAEEAAMYLTLLRQSSARPPRSLFELGAGGGNNALHMKSAFSDVVLTDLSDGMLEHSRRINPECTHVVGDMRTLRLGRTFDCVFVHDAISYMTTEADLRAAMRTAFEHCAPGGAALFCPDHLAESFAPSTSHGGEDGDGRALRYLEWSWDPDPADTTVVTDYTYVLRERSGDVRVIHDRHVEGLFPRGGWLRWLADAGFEAHAVTFDHSELEPGSYELFICRR